MHKHPASCMFTQEAGFGSLLAASAPPDADATDVLGQLPAAVRAALMSSVQLDLSIRDSFGSRGSRDSFGDGFGGGLGGGFDGPATVEQLAVRPLQHIHIACSSSETTCNAWRSRRSL